MHLFHTDRPAAINHNDTNGDVTAQLVSLTSVNVTWREPKDNNADITHYTIMFCAIASPTNNTDCSGVPFDNRVPVAMLTRVDENRLSYVYNELLTEKMYEVVIRAENEVGEQMSPTFGNGFPFNSAFPDDGQVVSVGFIPLTRVVIVTWELPPLALALAQDNKRLNVSFNITYINNGARDMPTTEIVEYNRTLMVQGVSIDLLRADSAEHTVEITAIYTIPSFVGTLFSLSPVSTLDTSKRGVY